MKNIKSYKIFEEISPRIPRLTERGLGYWKSKGKRGKDVMIYTHDDMDGIYSAIAVRSRLEELGYNILGYGILNYMESWKNTKINPEIINVAVDFAEMPSGEFKDMIDIYIDHHGEYTEEEKDFYKDNPVIKTKSGSAYEGICRVMGKQIDEITLYSIDMIDSAKYDDYMVDWRDIINFSWDRFIEIASKPGKVTIKPFEKSKSVTFGWPIVAKLTFAGAFNQFLKRGDHKTIIEVIDNVKEPSIYAIYIAMKKIYPGNNIWKTGEGKDFINDSTWRIETMKKRTRGDDGQEKPIYMSQKEFLELGGGVSKGYQLIGKLMYVPSGTWANALRARSILMIDIDKGVVPKDQIEFILLQYGNTIQIVSVDKIENIEELPVLKTGEILNNLGKYMTNILKNFKKYFGYYDPDTTIGQDELTVSGGHIGIGTISNIVGRIDYYSLSNKSLSETSKKLIKKYHGYKYLDLIKNKIIADLSGLGEKWPIGLVWSNGEDSDPKPQMIRDIINHHKVYINRIKDYLKYGDDEGRGEREIKKEIKDELLLLSDEDLRVLHQEAMMNYKVMLKPEIRQIGVKGDIPSREEWNNSKKIKTFENFRINLK